MSDLEISALEVYSMVVARDALIEQLLTVAAGPAIASLWNVATAEIDREVRNGLLKDIMDADG